MSKERYNVAILEVVQVIQSSNVNQTNKGEFFGYFLDRLIHRYVQTQPARSDQFNANLFPAATRKSLEMLADRLATLIGSADPLEVATDLRDVIVAVLAYLSKDQKEGVLLFLKGCLQKVMLKIDTALDASLGVDNKDRVIASRRRVAALGVLAHISENLT